MTADYKTAMAAAFDAANRNARMNGRAIWSDEDRSVAAETFHRIFGLVEA